MTQKSKMKNTLFLSFALGFITASPVGPMGLICLQRTISRGFVPGLISASGIACAYAFWSYTAIHGLSTISNWIEQEKSLFQIAIGISFFLYGLHGVLNASKQYHHNLQYRKGAAEFLSTFLVVFLNPSTFIMFSVLFTVFGLTKKHFALYESLEIASSVFLGSIGFWIVLSQMIHRTRWNMNYSTYNLISRISSYAIMIFGIAIFIIW
jgi:threonine/homoserine/homoserine lactone efflux protein